MELVVKRMRWLAIIALSWGVIACSSKADPVNVPTSEDALVGTISFDVYKSPTCGCCENWVSHVEAAGFEAVLHHPVDLNKLKADKGISPRYQSCHTAVTQDGYLFEGHIPADVIKRFLANPPFDAIGLAVPGMPVGSPGMEVDDKFQPYRILLLKSDGTHEIYANVQSYKEQF